MRSSFKVENDEPEIKSLCKSLFEESAKDKKKCFDITMDCHMNKCRKEIEDKENSTLTIEDVKKCSKEFKGDIKKKLKCRKKILEKNDFYEKHAKMSYCTANKCPEMTDLLSNAIHNNYDRMVKSGPYYGCVEKNCKEEYDEMIKNNKIENTCYKKYDKYNDQLKCFRKITGEHIKAISKFYKCRDINCKIDNKQNKKNTKTKKTNTKKTHTKKSKKY